MNVGELEDLLARLPADMPVHVALDGGGCYGCRHITVVDKHPKRRDRDGLLADMGATTLIDGTVPPSLVLRAGHGAPLWFEAWADDVEYELHGRWPASPPRRPR